jgi:peroxiredoxin
MRRAAFALVALAVAACGGGAGAGRKSGVASNFSAVDTAGRNFQLKDHLGKNVVYVDFWATFCQPCLAAMPHLKGMHEKYGPKGFTVVAVSMDGPESIGDVRAFVERNKLPFPVVLDEDSSIAAAYNPRKSAPLGVLIDRTGKIVKVHEGYNQGDERLLDEEVAALVDAPRAP